MAEHQESFEKLKEALISGPVLSYPDYSKPLVLETDASLKGLGTVLLQEDGDGNLCVVSYVSQTLKPYEHLMKNYSSTTLKLMALKWSVYEKFRDYLIGLKFTVLTDNNPLTYVHTSWLGAAQICWLSDLSLFDFDIQYHAGKSNQVADALSQQPVNPESSSESSDDEEEWKTISYFPMAHGVEVDLGGLKLLQINPELSGLLCSGLDSLGANWEGLDLARMLCLGYSFIEHIIHVHRIPGPSTTGIYNVHL